ncbi:hypothetical protein N177_1728 [Lutibaculum baratangense AMV1]|uniref:Uncharacterized protein n=1 Tax=Lutibaculum baratangense AMV1 TaxID=631454 RepID=V4THC5_9HYPH|nr:hypothetical protein N177_1728 [Lutibaculum baratangense AMV1]
MMAKVRRVSWVDSPHRDVVGLSNSPTVAASVIASGRPRHR